jgi:DNA-binding GntR family transcriptional regulator
LHSRIIEAPILQDIEKARQAMADEVNPSYEAILGTIMDDWADK